MTDTSKNAGVDNLAKSAAAAAKSENALRFLQAALRRGVRLPLLKSLEKDDKALSKEQELFRK